MSDQITERPDSFPNPRTFAGADSTPADLAKPRSSFWRYALPGVLFVVIVGGIAWVTQFMPKSRSSNTNTEPAPEAGKPVIRFPLTRVIWNAEDKDYVNETEQVKGSFEFPFENITDAAAEIGAFDVACDCSIVEAALVDRKEFDLHAKRLMEAPLEAKAGNWKWQKLTRSPAVKPQKDEVHSFAVPANATGFVRLKWDPHNKPPGSKLQLTVDVWSGPAGNVRQRRADRLEVPIAIVAPLQFKPGRVRLGELGSGNHVVAEFTLWSATRSQVNVEFADKTPDKLVVPVITPFTVEERQALQDRLRKEDMGGRVKAAYHLRVTVKEQDGDKQLDQGAFYRFIPLLVDGALLEPSPLLVGTIRSDVEVAGGENKGGIQLNSFAANQEHKAVFPLFAHKNIQLRLERSDPSILVVKLHKKELTGERQRWLLEVIVPANSIQGKFAEHSAIILRASDNPPRFIRIPVLGNATQN
ncbi:MAG: hypothetical protein L0Y72_06040 [Gemmataceae bacterium]|nr:hypothetical protein [Gemmataceae bacterium]MCI0738586.1 hypothetical protein [Gemmataceae bacterium]